MFSKKRLDSGLRIVSVPMESLRTLVVLTLVGAGSKYEKREEAGIAHFLEHMFFKGTKKRPTELEVGETIDRVGGQINAFTSKEYVGYYAKVRSEHRDLALEWMSDILLNSKFEEEEIEREKGVVTEEINMYFDTPRDYIWDLFESLLYGDQPAGRSVLGKKETVQGFSQNDLFSYVGDHYSTRNTVLVLAGDIKPSFSNKVSKFFKDQKEKEPKGKREVEESQDEPGFKLMGKKTDQAHLSLGVRGVHYFSEDRCLQEVVAHLLGGMMSSRLFISLRSKWGLAYYVYSNSQTYTDSGYLATVAGVDKNRVEKAVSLILDEYRSLREKKVSEKELAKAKEHFKGYLSLALEKSEGRASFYGKQELLGGKMENLEAIFEKVDGIGANDVSSFCRKIFRPENLNLALIGPYREEERFKNLIKNF